MGFKEDILQYDQLITDRYEYIQEYREISNYLLPGRGILQTFSKPQKRKLTSPNIINPAAVEAMGILTAELHSRLTSPSRPWFKLNWDKDYVKKVQFLDWWLQDAEDKLMAELNQSNFYSAILTFYDEWVGFGTGSVFVGANDGPTALRFEPLTVGEYVIAVDAKGKVDTLFRTIFKSPRNVIDMFGEENVSDAVKLMADRKHPTRETQYVILIESVKPELYQDKPFKQTIYEYSLTGKQSIPVSVGQLEQRKPLLEKGFYEFPYPTCRWSIIGSDIYGLGPGSKSLPDNKRLQEIEAAFLMAIHKSVDPPVTAPNRYKNSLTTLPGGFNFLNNPNDKIESLYNFGFDYQGAAAAIERVERRIKNAFYNDIFFTANRDPNATPYKATEVAAREREKMTRLGPVVERAQNEFFVPLVERCFNIMYRKGLFEPIPEQYLQMVSDFSITMVSPLAQAQKLVALESIENFMVYVGQIAQYDQKVLDKVDSDKITDEIADISGVSSRVLRPEDEVNAIRKQRAEMEKRQADMQNQMMMQQFQMDMAKQQADVSKARADVAETIEGLNA
jgi:hypothetical protein